MDIPVANFDYFSPVQGTFNFNNNSTNATSYEWDFGDGSPVVNEEMPFYIYNTFGVFEVTLTASNAYCSNTFMDTISFLTNVDELELTGVNIFPNPASDLITIQLQNDKQASIEVFSIDGKKLDFIEEKIYHSKSIDISLSLIHI